MKLKPGRSNAAQLGTIDPTRQRQQSESTHHDLITADQRSLPDLFLLAPRPPYRGSHSSSQFADSCTRNHLVQSTVHSFTSGCSSSRYPKNISLPVPPSLRQHRRRAEISIAFLPHRPPA